MWTAPCRPPARPSIRGAASSPPSGKPLLKLAELVDAEFNDLALLDVLEMGRPITAALGLRGMVERSLRHFAGAATAIHGQTLGNSFPVELLSYTLREPVGVVGAIIPWNGRRSARCGKWGRCWPPAAPWC
jgi:acyl-CoA reductase-like NAD-dependent aldehyde dehydrogenase